MGFFSSEETTNKTANTSSSSQTNPWAGQLPFLMQGFQGASGALTQAQGAPKPTDFVAGLTPEQNALYQRMISFGNTGAGAGSALVGQGVDAFTRGMTGLSGYTPTSFEQSLLKARSAMDDPSVQGMVDAATRDARDAAGQAIRRNNQSAAGSGNINSSRAGITEGLVADRLARTVGDISSSIRGNAFDRAFSGALDAARFGDQSRLDAAQSLLAAGPGAVGAGAGAGNSTLATGATGASGLQTGNQLALDNLLARYQFGTQSPFDALNNFWKIVGGNSWGSSTNSNSTSNETAVTEKDPSTLAKIGSVAQIAGSFF